MINYLKLFEYEKSKINNIKEIEKIKNCGFCIEKNYEIFMGYNIKNIFLKDNLGVKYGSDNRIDSFDFLHDKENNFEGIINDLESYDFLIDNKLLPVGGTISGDLLCLLCDNDRENRVYLWDHEVDSMNELEGLILIAESFKEMLNNIVKIEDIGDSDLGNDNIIKVTTTKSFEDRIKNIDWEKYR